MLDLKTHRPLDLKETSEAVLNLEVILLVVMPRNKVTTEVTKEMVAEEIEVPT